MRTLALLVALALPASARTTAPLADRLIALRRDLHRHPELANRETRTMAAIAAYLKALGIEDVKTGVAKTGVVATIKGGAAGPTIALRAPIDAFGIQEKKDSAYKSETPGVSHACGHDAMIAALLGAAELLQERRAGLPGTIKLIFQPAEEGTPPGEDGGAPLMLKEGILDGVSALLAFHVDETIPFGEAGLHEAAVYAGADTLEVTVLGQSAHGATPWKGVDAIAVAGQIVSGLQLVASRQTDVWEPVVLTLGTIQGGTRPNGTAGEAKLTGTLRTYSASSRAKARESAQRIVTKVAEAFGAQGSLAFSDSIPPTVNDAALVAKLRPALARALGGAGKLRVMKPLSYADDFSVLSEKVPAFYFQLGVGGPGYSAGTHTETFDLDERAIPLGAKLLADLATAALRP